MTRKPPAHTGVAAASTGTPASTADCHRTGLGLLLIFAISRPWVAFHHVLPPAAWNGYRHRALPPLRRTKVRLHSQQVRPGRADHTVCRRPSDQARRRVLPTTGTSGFPPRTVIRGQPVADVPAVLKISADPRRIAFIHRSSGQAHASACNSDYGARRQSRLRSRQRSQLVLASAEVQHSSFDPAESRSARRVAVWLRSDSFVGRRTL